MYTCQTYRADGVYVATNGSSQGVQAILSIYEKTSLKSKLGQLGQTTEFSKIRTMMPCGSFDHIKYKAHTRKVEGLFIYFFHQLRIEPAIPVLAFGLTSF